MRYLFRLLPLFLILYVALTVQGTDNGIRVSQPLEDQLHFPLPDAGTLEQVPGYIPQITERSRPLQPLTGAPEQQTGISVQPGKTSSAKAGIRSGTHHTSVPLYILFRRLQVAEG